MQRGWSCSYLYYITGYLLFRSLRKQLRRVNFEEQPEPADDGPFEAAVVTSSQPRWIPWHVLCVAVTILFFRLSGWQWNVQLSWQNAGYSAHGSFS